jgi:hypothetical protein
MGIGWASLPVLPAHGRVSADEGSQHQSAVICGQAGYAGALGSGVGFGPSDDRWGDSRAGVGCPGGASLIAPASCHAGTVAMCPELPSRPSGWDRDSIPSFWGGRHGIWLWCHMLQGTRSRRAIRAWICLQSWRSPPD